MKKSALKEAIKSLLKENKYTTSNNLKKYFNTCTSYEFIKILEDGIRIRFYFPNKVTLIVDASNNQLEPFM